MPPRITLLLGKPPRRGTLLAEVAEHLASAGTTVRLRLPHDAPVAHDDLVGEALVVQRGLADAVDPLLEAAHADGTTLCNPWPAERILRDRLAWRAALREADIPIPEATTTDDWATVVELADGGDVVAKSLSGPGRGETVLSGTGETLPRAAPFAGPYIVEERLEFDGLDRKLYVVGDEVRGLLKASTLELPHGAPGEPFQPAPHLVELALRTREALGAHLVGVDVVETPTGGRVVDVNSFPGYRGVADADRLVAGHLLAHVNA